MPVLRMTCSAAIGPNCCLLQPAPNEDNTIGLMLLGLRCGMSCSRQRRAAENVLMATYTAAALPFRPHITSVSVLKCWPSAGFSTAEGRTRASHAVKTDIPRSPLFH